MSSGCRAGSADRPEEPILPASSPLLLLLLCTRATDRKLIGQLLCLPDLRLAYWPVLVSPPRPQSPILSQYESMLQTWPVTNTASPTSNPTLSSSCHLACAALFTSARLGCPTCRDLYDLHAHVHPIDFPTRFTNAGNPSSPSVPPSRQLPPEPVPFPAVSRCRAPVVFPGTSSGRVLSSWRAAALPQSCFFVSPTQQSRGSWSGTQPPPGALLYAP